MSDVNSKNHAFTLIEIMIVILIISVLMAVAVPAFMMARETSRAKSCIGNLKQIDSAMQQWAMDTKAPSTATPGSTDLAPTYLKNFPTCPSMGTYTIGPVNATPTCSIGANATSSNLSHVLQ